jgi:small subunit ribosomal protein S4
MGWAASRAEARQIVRHRHLAVNGVAVDIPSFQVRQGDEITVRAASKEHPRVKLLVEAGGKTTPAWLEVNRGEMKAKVVALPSRSDVDLPVQESLIVELYSK